MKKRILSGLLAISMVFGSAAMLPVGTFTQSTSISVSAENAPTSGKCGENVSWSLKNGVLTISGTGNMYDYESEASPFNARDDIKSVVIKSGVTSIGAGAFYLCSLTNVTIPDSVKQIGISSFFCCPNLTNISIPNGVTSIENSAFYDCHNLKSVTLPDSVKSIGYSAFSGCFVLSSITIPSSVTSISDSTFQGCTSLTNVNIPNSVTKIGYSAFQNCKNLTSVIIPKSVINIGANAFSETKWLKDQQKKNPLVIVNGILIDGTKCSGKVTIPKSVTYIGENAFYACKDLTGITIPNSVKSIDNSAFESCAKLSSITISESVESIGARSFFECFNLKSITIPDSVKSIGIYAFYNCMGLKKVNIPKSMTVIEGGVFMGCDSLTEISIPNGIKTVGSSAFFNCGNLTSVTIPKSVSRIDYQAFGYYWGSKVDGFTVKGYTGSAGEKYAKDNGFKFVSLDTIEPTIIRLAGAGRYETAVEISKAGFPDGSDTVVLAYGLNYADALAGVSLAKAKNAPILLTNLKTLPAETLAEIKRLKAKNVIILGGTGAVGKEVEAALNKEGLKTERIAGATRFETATKIAQKMQVLNDNKAPEDIFFVYAFNSADALSVSAVAAVKGAPVIYLKTTGDLDDATAAYLKSIKGSVKNAYVIGGEGVISKDMMKKTRNALDVTPVRVFGANRFETCVAVNEKFADVLDGDMLCVATGMDFPDALAGGVYAALNKAPLFLINGKAKTPDLADEQKAYLKAKAASLITAFGGVGVVPDNHITDIAKNLT